jgi:O-antigen/teichoic acid export membrane protein
MIKKLTDERYKRIFFSSISGVTGKIITAAINLITVPLALNYLGVDKYAVWIIVSSLVVWMQLADFGFGAGLANTLAEANGLDDHKSAATYLSTSVCLVTIISLILIPAVYFISLYFPWGLVFKLEKADQILMAQEAFQIVGFMFLLNMPLALISRVYTAYQRGYLVSLSQISASIITFFLIVMAIYFDLGMMTLVMILSATSIVLNIFLWAVFFLTGYPFKLAKLEFNKKSILRVGSVSLPMFILQIGALSVNELIVISIAQLGTLEQVTEFSLVQRVYLLGFVVASAITAPFYPAIRESFEKKQIIWLKLAIMNSLKIRLSFVFVYSLILLIFGDHLMKLWVGVDAAPYLGFIGWLSLAICMGMSSYTSLLGETLSSLDILWRQVAFVFITAITIVLFLIICFPRFGITAVYISTSISTLIPMLWYSGSLKKIIKEKDHE